MTQMIDPERLKQVRKTHGLTQEALARKARLNKQTIYRLERDKRPVRPANLGRLAQALEVDPKVLTGQAAIPPIVGQPRNRAEEASYQLNVRVQPGSATRLNSQRGGTVFPSRRSPSLLRFCSSFSPKPACAIGAKSWSNAGRSTTNIATRRN